MDEKTRLLVCLGSAVSANCIPCFEFYYGKAQAAGVAPADVQEAIEIAQKIKNNINMLMKTNARKLLGQECEVCPPTGCKPQCS